MGRFDQLLRASDKDLFWGVIYRIEDHRWRLEKIRGLPVEQARVIRIARFRLLFGNGGLQDRFECDLDLLGSAIIDDVHAVGLARSADALRAAYDLFRTPDDWSDWERRMETLNTRRAELEACDAVLWSEFDLIEAAGGRFIRENVTAFEDLRWKRPYDPASKRYEEELE